MTSPLTLIAVWSMIAPLRRASLLTAHFKEQIRCLLVALHDRPKRLLTRHLCTIQSPLLLREFIQHHLYDEKSGYFAQHVQIGGSDNQGMQEPIEYNTLFDEDDFKLELKAKYKQGMI